MPNIYSAHVLLMQAYHGRLQDGLVSSEQARSSVPAGRLGRLQNLSDAPITLLVGSMALAKMYMIHHILQVVIETLKCRLSPRSFDEICTAAIERDVTVLRLFCVQYAQEKLGQIFGGYHGGNFSAVVESELAGLFGEPLHHKKRQRVS